LPMSPLSKLPYVEHHHAAGSSSYTVSQAFSSKSLGAHHCKTNYCTTVH
jgi:hypothetical protein